MINDPYFRVEIDKDASSPSPQTSIWRGQHQCVSEGFAFDDPAPSSDRCGEVIVKHQLAGDRGHYSVLDHAFIKLDFGWFPHSVLVQITRHHDSSFLVQSGRYTGQRFLRVAHDELDVEEVFYFRPTGQYGDRSGSRYEYTDSEREDDKTYCKIACYRYASKIASGFSEEHARDSLPYNFRQHFTMSGTLKDFFHWVDQRSKKDSQLEIQALTQMAFEKVSGWSPELCSWYKETRYGKARLAP